MRTTGPPKSRLRAAFAVCASAVALVSACSGHAKPSAAPSATPTPTATTPTTPPPALCPLTGSPATGGRRTDRVALAVKIDNIDPARPQAGLDHADLVVEEMVEGGLTRLFVVFQCDHAALVGPIRSARPVDADLLALLHGSVFGYSGANPKAIVPVQAHGDAVLISNDALPQYFHRDPSRPAPHNVFSSTDRILAGGLARRHGLTAPRPLFTYGPLPAGARPAHSVSMSWPAASASWTWTGTTWARTQNGSPDVLRDGRRVHAANVIVLSVEVRPSGIRDVAGNETPDDIVVGTGPVWVFRDGRVVTGHWSRAKVTARWRLLDAHGHVIRLAPGVTWVELLPRPRTPTVAAGVG